MDDGRRAVKRRPRVTSFMLWAYGLGRWLARRRTVYAFLLGLKVGWDDLHEERMREREDAMTEVNE